MIFCLGSLGYLAHTNSRTYNDAGNFLHKVQWPPPPAISVEAVRQEEALAAAAKAVQPSLVINGKEIVTVREPSREEWARIDAKAASHAMIRKIYQTRDIE